MACQSSQLSPGVYGVRHTNRLATIHIALYLFANMAAVRGPHSLRPARSIEVLDSGFQDPGDEVHGTFLSKSRTAPRSSKGITHSLASTNHDARCSIWSYCSLKESTSRCWHSWCCPRDVDVAIFPNCQQHQVRGCRVHQPPCVQALRCHGSG